MTKVNTSVLKSKNIYQMISDLQNTKSLVMVQKTELSRILNSKTINNHQREYVKRLYLTVFKPVVNVKPVVEKPVERLITDISQISFLRTN